MTLLRAAQLDLLLYIYYILRQLHLSTHVTTYTAPQQAGPHLHNCTCHHLHCFNIALLKKTRKRSSDRLSSFTFPWHLVVVVWAVPSFGRPLSYSVNGLAFVKSGEKSISWLTDVSCNELPPSSKCDGNPTAVCFSTNGVHVIELGETDHVAKQ